MCLSIQTQNIQKYHFKFVLKMFNFVRYIKEKHRISIYKFLLKILMFVRYVPCYTDENSTVIECHILSIKTINIQNKVNSVWQLCSPKTNHLEITQD